MDLQRGGWYRVTLDSGADSNAGIASEEKEIFLQVICDDPASLLCPEYEPREAKLFPEEDLAQPEPENKQGCHSKSVPKSWLLSLFPLLYIQRRKETL